jgi:hypothetical protein
MVVNNQNNEQHMKKARFLFFAVFILAGSRIQAQGFHLGVKAGANIAKVNGRAFSDGFQWGYCVGAFAELNVSSKWGVQPEVLFSQTNTQTATSFEEIIPTGFNDVKVNLDYLTIPILLSYKPIPLLSLQIGPQFGILMNSNQTVAGNGKNAFKSGDFSMVGGAQMNLGPVKAGARYILGLTNINDVNNVDTWNTQNFQLYIGLRLF